MPKLPLQNQRNWIDGYSFKTRIVEKGTVTAVGDGIVWIQGLPSIGLDELVKIQDGSLAVVANLSHNLVGATLVKQTPRLTAGQQVEKALGTLKVAVGDTLLGRVVDPLAEPLDGQPPVARTHLSEIDVSSPGIVDRDFVSKPFLTGTKMIDTLVPIGKGQRQLIIGDNGLGKSSLALDILLNQKQSRVKCVYVTIGQQRSSVINFVNALKEHGALEHTVIVVAEATALPGLRYLAPYSGCAMAEHWMRQGHDTLIIYDDLTAHADSYREVSLLLRRPPGREAYPADIFYLHSRLLERSTCLKPSLGGGSMTAFPIVETRQGQIAAYIPTNLISITDGQIYFDSKLFAQGFLPAIDLSRSVSRIGGKAQQPQVQQESARMKMDYLQFLDLEVFTRFGAKLDPARQLQIHRGQILRQVFKQPRLRPLSIEQQYAWLIAFNERLLDELTLDQVPRALDKIYHVVLSSGLTLNHPREEWVDLLQQETKVKVQRASI